MDGEHARPQLLTPGDSRRAGCGWLPVALDEMGAGGMGCRAGRQALGLAPLYMRRTATAAGARFLSTRECNKPRFCIHGDTNKKD